MPIKVDWRGRLESLPGTYVDTKSGFPTPNAVDSAGDIMYIDTGSILQQEYLLNATQFTNINTIIPQDGNAAYAVAGGVDRVNPTSQMIWSGGKGIIGEFESNDNCVYKFDRFSSFQSFVKGGTTADIAKRFFYPLANGGGTANLYYARACQTKAAIATKTLAGGGTFRIYTKDEGTAPCSRFEMTTLNSQVLKTGYALRLLQGTSPTAFYIEIWQGSYKGSDNTYIADKTVNYTGVNAVVMQQGNTFAGSTSLNSFAVVEPTLIYRSREFTDLLTMRTICEASSEFNSRFYFPNPIIHIDPVTNLPVYGISTTGTYAIVAGDLTNTTPTITYSGYIPFMRGTNNGATAFTNIEDFSASTTYDRLLEVIIDLQNTFFFCDRWGKTDPITPANNHPSGGALATTNVKLLNHIKTQAAYEKFMFVGGGTKDTQFDAASLGSQYVSETYDDQDVVVVHSGVTLKPQPTVFSTHPDYLPKESVYLAAIVAGRLAGLAPQTPGTHKNLDISTITHPLTKTEGELAGDKGVLYVRYRHNMGWVINHSINSLQKNSVVLNEDGTTPEISVARIAGQLHKELINSCNKRFVGTNIGQSTPATVKAFVENYLKGRVATDQQDGLIISFQDVTVHFQDDWYLIEYGFVPNYPVNKIFIRSFILPYNPITI